MKTLFNVPIILASNSPRRRDLLQAAGVACQIVVPDIDETPKRGERASTMVKRLAKEKAEAVTDHVIWKYGCGIIIAADTTVVGSNNRILGKPRDERDAVRMLKFLQGRVHTVYTGYAVLAVGREIPTEKIVRVVSTRVRMRALKTSEIERYVKTKEPMDKAGAYAAQGIGMSLIESISGSYSNVVGLPLCQVLLDLEKKFGVTLFEGLKELL